MLLMGLGLLGRRRRWGPGFSGAGLALIWLASMPWLSRQLVRGLEEQAVRLTPASLPNADAVLVLGVVCCPRWRRAVGWRWPMPAIACSPAWI